MKKKMKKKNPQISQMTQIKAKRNHPQIRQIRQISREESFNLLNLPNLRMIFFNLCNL